MLGTRPAHLCVITPRCACVCAAGGRWRAVLGPWLATCGPPLQGVHVCEGERGCSAGRHAPPRLPTLPPSPAPHQRPPHPPLTPPISPCRPSPTTADVCAEACQVGHRGGEGVPAARERQPLPHSAGAARAGAAPGWGVVGWGGAHGCSSCLGAPAPRAAATGGPSHGLRRERPTLSEPLLRRRGPAAPRQATLSSSSCAPRAPRLEPHKQPAPAQPPPPSPRPPSLPSRPRTGNPRQA